MIIRNLLVFDCLGGVALPLSAEVTFSENVRAHHLPTLHELPSPRRSRALFPDEL